MRLLGGLACVFAGMCGLWIAFHTVPNPPTVAGVLAELRDAMTGKAAPPSAAPATPGTPAGTTPAASPAPGGGSTPQGGPGAVPAGAAPGGTLT